MRSAAQKFVGEHDFRNFCKVLLYAILVMLVVVNVIVVVLCVRWMSMLVSLTSEGGFSPSRWIAWVMTSKNQNPLKSDQFMTNVFCGSSPYQMCVMTVSGQAFLWHQVRCMTAILLLISQGLEQPEVCQSAPVVGDNGETVSSYV